MDPFGLSSFIAPAIVQFLGVRSLVRFGATSKFHKGVLLGEVERRRKQIVAVEAEVAQLLASRPDAVPTRMNVIAATKLVECTRRLIDDELDFHDKIGKRELIIDNDEYTWKELDPFFQERMKFLPGSTGEREAGSLYVLPMCFYCPPEDESSNPCREDVAEATEYARMIYGVQRQLMQVHDYPWGWDRLNYEQPLRKFDLIGAERFARFMKVKAGEFVQRGMDDDAWGMADAFRIAAREVFFKSPGARDCLWYTIERVDLIAIERAIASMNQLCADSGDTVLANW
jgi:hypothetical protein